MKSFGIGLLGYGGIGKVHTLGYRMIPSLYPDVPPIRLRAVCTSSPASAETAAREGGFDRSYATIDDLLRDPDVSVVDCALPNMLHHDAIRKALAAGKHVYCEKPLARTLKEAREVAQAAKDSDRWVGMTFNYRFIPAVMRAKLLCEEGALGEIYHFSFEYLHSGYQDRARPLSWRLREEASGGGALVDLGSHAIDLARHLVGEFASVAATTKVYVGDRPLAPGSVERGPVTVDDAAWVWARMTSGAVGTIAVSRFATGALDDLRFRIEGSTGALRFDLMDANWLYFHDARRPGNERGWTRLETVQSYPGAVVPPARAVIGWERSHAENQYRFLKALAEERSPSPNVADGLRTQLVIHAAYRSAEEGGWVPVETA